MPSAAQPESLKAETSEHGHQYSYPSSAASYSYESAQKLNAAFSQPQTSSHMQSLAPFSNVSKKTFSAFCSGCKMVSCSLLGIHFLLFAKKIPNIKTSKFEDDFSLSVFGERDKELQFCKIFSYEWR